MREIFAGTPRGGPWRIGGVSDDGSTVDIKDDRHTVVIGLAKGKADLICAEHNAILADTDSEEIRESVPGCMHMPRCDDRYECVERD